MIAVGLVGCGAVSQIYYRPALAALAERGVLRLTAVFDPDADAAAKLARGLGESEIAPSFAALVDRQPDLIIVASPPRFHAEQAVAALRAGIAVHCEKPLAPSRAEGEGMVAEAALADRLLSVGMIRRRLGPARTIKALLAAGTLGAVRSIDWFEGGPFHWPVQSPAYFDRTAGAAGVFEDIGSHVLDLLGWWLGAPGAVAYADDAMGGVEANCLVQLGYGAARAQVRLSRDWHRPNGVRIAGERGAIVWDVEEDILDLTLDETGVATRLAVDGAGFEQGFIDQLADVCAILGGGSGSYVAGADVLPTLRLIDQCRAARTPMDMPWLS